MRSVIFANGNPPTESQAAVRLKQNDLLIAADGGARACAALGLQPHVLIGDFDSLSPLEVESFTAQGAQVVRHPRRKDFTDLELALTYAAEQGSEEALVYGALGLRWDMTLANLLLPAAAHLQGMTVRLLDGLQEICLLCPGRALELSGQPGDTVSLVPVGGDALEVTTEGLEYPLHAETLYFGATRGVSNTLVGERAWVSLGSGLLICTLIHHDLQEKI